MGYGDSTMTAQEKLNKIKWNNTMKHPFIGPYLRPHEKKDINLALRQCGRCGGALVMHGLTRSFMDGSTFCGGRLVCPGIPIEIPPETTWIYRKGYHEPGYF
jgi:hypothetical protein